jgi:hypothetical protein
MWVSQNKFRGAVNFSSQARVKNKRLRAQNQCTRSQRTTQWQQRNLPAVAAVSTVAAISAASTATATSAAIASAPATATTAAIASAPTAATRTLGLRTRLIDYQVPATEILTVEIGDRAIRFFIIRDLDEGKTPRLAREPIPNQIDCGRVDPYLSEPLLQLLFRCREREITDVKLLHLGTPSARNLTTIAERTEIPIRQVGKPEGVPRGRGRFSGPGDTLENRYLLQPEKVAGPAVPKAARESRRQRKVIGCAHKQAEKQYDDTWHNDEFSVNAPNHP